MVIISIYLVIGIQCILLGIQVLKTNIIYTSNVQGGPMNTFSVQTISLHYKF